MTKVNRAIAYMMKKLYTFLVAQRKPEKVISKRVSIKDRIRTFDTSKELSREDIGKRSLENRPPRYWSTKDNDLREILIQKNTNIEKSMSKKPNGERCHQDEEQKEHSHASGTIPHQRFIRHTMDPTRTIKLPYKIGTQKGKTKQVMVNYIVIGTIINYVEAELVATIA
ncbi:hypothetical protein Cgig2_013682 [Carnegiea gigantea]|uniref:Uncharacterized protein n=1 Tax=Carnegiea gigantea TaxID=171969 RepID=A0A9Q1QGG4_9CARY|nr:hypothetical protein Cgig2_013682 [Carnegiea gigantea]